MKYLLALCALLWMGAAQAAGIERLYVLDCGWAHAPDQARWSPGVNAGIPIDVSDNCYLIRHSSGQYLMWDTGIAESVAAAPDGVPGAGGMVWHRPQTIVAQLQELGLTPGDIKLVGISHFHPDHTGNVDLFDRSTVLIQAAEWDYAFKQAKPPFSAAHPAMKLDGDKDIFGDGSAVLIAKPGHTPGHQSLLLLLPKTGYVILSGDAAHFQANFDNRRVPSMNTDKDQTVASMDRIAALMREKNAQLWINHDKPSSDARKHAPQYYD